jgi:hypothetical protein
MCPMIDSGVLGISLVSMSATWLSVGMYSNLIVSSATFLRTKCYVLHVHVLGPPVLVDRIPIYGCWSGLTKTQIVQKVSQVS